jgi:predicted aminopeptidase
MNTKIFSLIAMLLLSSCAKMGYVYDQGLGQLRLQWNGEENQKILSSTKLTKEHKDKIKKIIKYKNYFYDFFGKETTDIYSKTTILDQEAVTYLVIASPIHEIKPKKFEFPIVGSFPYLGFFEKKKAEAFEVKMKQAGYATYLRPVYAYSTLGYFEDRILSSFFYYDDFTLAQIIFHELFHTIFFMKDDVDLNENLANYFGEQLALEYYKKSPEVIEKFRKKIERNRKLQSALQQKTKILRSLYKNQKQKGAKAYLATLKKFMNEDFNPSMNKLCSELELQKDKCFPLKGNWNNAKFAAYASYEKDIDVFTKIHKRLGYNLEEYFAFIEIKYKKYTKDKPKLSFAQFLKQEDKL